MVEASKLGTIRCKISGIDLKDLDYFSKSDPICMIETKEGQLIWKPVGQTERINNDLNPVFKIEPEFDYISTAQLVKFTMWDDDGGGDYELIGSVELTISAILELIETAGGVFWHALKHNMYTESIRGDIRVEFSLVSE